MEQNYEYFDEDEPMEVDTSGLKTPTPMKPVSLGSTNKDELDVMSSPHNATTTSTGRPKLTGSSGAKIVKAIRPNGLAAKSASKPLPPVPTFYNDEELAIGTVDPFKSRPRIGFDESATSSSSSISDSAPATVVPTNVATDDWEANHNGCSTSSSSSSSSSSSASTVSKPADVMISVDTQSNEQINPSVTAPQVGKEQQQLSPAPSSSAVSSSATDTSSVGSLSPQHGQTDQPASAAELKSAELDDQFGAVKFKSTFDDNDENARTPTNQTGSSKVTFRSDNGAISNQGSFDLMDFPAAQPNSDVAIVVNECSVNNVFESIFSNETDFQSFLDVLEKKEITRPENVRISLLLYSLSFS